MAKRTKLTKAEKAWCNWYSAKLDRINFDLSKVKRETHEDYSPAEQDLFESFGCRTFND